MERQRKMTDEQVVAEIERLKKDPDVKLAVMEEQLRNRLRKYLYTLQSRKKHGKALRDAGLDEDALRNLYSSDMSKEEIEKMVNIKINEKRK